MVEQNRVQWVYSSQNNQELAERYDQWSEDYDSDLEQVFAWNAPRRATEIFARHVPKHARILDAGAGTGLVGLGLSQLGYSQLTAMDLSLGMLDQSRQKNVYKEFLQMVMGERLDIPNGAFDAVISVGVFTLGHAPASSLDELVRITSPKGYIVFSLRTNLYEDGGFREMQASLESASRWQLVETSDIYQPMPKGEPETFHQIWVYQVLG